MGNKNNQDNRIKPQTLKGFRDILPEEMNARDRIIKVIREVFEFYGFSPMASPALEYKEVLCGYGDEASKQIYTFTDPDGNEVGLRFDLTVPLSRIVSQYRDLPRPFKRYQIQPVWRYDKPDPGRFREFLQFDIDTIGTKSLVADSEILAAMNDSLTKLGVKFRIRFSSRKILSSMIKFAGIDEKLTKDVLRVIDKLDKQGIANVKLELADGRIDSSGDKIPGIGLNQGQIEKIEQYLKLPNTERKETLQALRELLSGVEGAKENIDELEQIDCFLGAMNVPDENIVIDPSIARGLDYYTGPIYEAIMLDAPRFGSVMGGGRYDNLIEIFTGQPTPAVGASIGVDRILSAMQSLGKVKSRAAVADVLVTVMDKERMPEYLKIAGELRDAGIKTEVFLGKAGSIGKQLKYADRQGHPFALILGQDEFDAGTVSLKDLRKIEDMEEEIADRDAWLKARIGQQTLKREELIPILKSMLNQLKS